MKRKRTKIGPNDIIAREFAPGRFGETPGSIAYRTTVGTLPRPTKEQLLAKRAAVKKAKSAKPVIVARAYKVDSLGRKHYGISVRNLARRSVGLPR